MVDSLRLSPLVLKGPPPKRRLLWSRCAPGALVFVVACVARLVTALISGGVGGTGSYDAGVYYAASAAVVGGRAPYRDFTLIHPPGITLLLAPFTLAARFTSDQTGFVLASLAAMSVGATSAVVVWLIVRRVGLGRPAALAAGLVYGAFSPSVHAEMSVRLEPFGNLFVLLGVLAFVTWSDDRRTRSTRSTLLAILTGVAFAAATSVKIWYVVPLVVVLLWGLVERRGIRHLGLVASGALAGFLLIDGPFFAIAPRQMVSSVILDQLGRPRIPISSAGRLESISGLATLGLPQQALGPALEVAGLATAVLCVLAWRNRVGRLAVVMLVSAVATLLLSPSYFFFYADYAVPALALVVGAALGRPVAAPRGRALARPSGPQVRSTMSVLVVAAVALCLVVADVGQPPTGAPTVSAADLRTAVAGARCVQSDQPLTLIQLDVLGRDLRNGCPQWVDVTGRTYGVDLRRYPSGTEIPRPLNKAWQRDLLTYLRAGNAVILTRAGTGVSAATRHALERGHVLGRAGRLRVYATPHGGSASG